LVFVFTLNIELDLEDERKILLGIALLLNKEDVDVEIFCD
jgi:hypothetical protein